MYKRQEEYLLKQLNGFEKDLEKLQSMRQRCMELWWKRGRLKSLDDESIAVKWEDFQEALDYGKPESLLRRTADLYERLRLLYHDMPVEGKYDGDEANIINYQRYEMCIRDRPNVMRSWESPCGGTSSWVKGCACILRENWGWEAWWN